MTLGLFVITMLYTASEHYMIIRGSAYSSTQKLLFLPYFLLS